MAVKPKPPLERVTQRAIVNGLRKLGLAVVAVPNGGQYSGSSEQRIRMAMAKRADGEVAGFPDLIVLTKRGTGRVGFIEVKRVGEVARENQIACHAHLAADGHPVVTVWSLDEAVAAVTGWGFIGVGA
jgi:hypothetical protein